MTASGAVPTAAAAMPAAAANGCAPALAAGRRVHFQDVERIRRNAFLSWVMDPSLGDDEAPKDPGALQAHQPSYTEKDFEDPGQCCDVQPSRRPAHAAERDSATPDLPQVIRDEPAPPPALSVAGSEAVTPAGVDGEKSPRKKIKRMSATRSETGLVHEICVQEIPPGEPAGAVLCCSRPPTPQCKSPPSAAVASLVFPADENDEPDAVDGNGSADTRQINVAIDNRQLFVQGFLSGPGCAGFSAMDPAAWLYGSALGGAAASLPHGRQCVGKAQFALPGIDSPSLPPIDWSKIDIGRKTDLCELLLQRIRSYINPDVEILIASEVFSCHLIVLQCYSSYFNAMKLASKVRLPDSSVTPRAFNTIYDWMINSVEDSYQLLTRGIVLEVLVATQYLGIQELEEHCWSFINNEKIFVEETAFLLYMEARKMSNEVIANLMLPRVQKFFLKLVGTEEFLRLSLEDICRLLSSHYIAVHSEVEVFMSAVRWLTFDWEQRRVAAGQVMACVRFGWIEPWQLVDVRRNPANPEFLQVTEGRDVRAQMDDGVAYATTKYGYGEQSSKLRSVIEALGLHEPKPRNWLQEGVRYTSFRQFVDDLHLYHLPDSLDALRFRADSAAAIQAGPQDAAYEHADSPLPFEDVSG